MVNPRVHIELVGSARLQQDCLRVVSKVGGEYVVHLGRSNGERELDSLELLRAHHGRVRHITGVKATGTKATHYILCAEAVTDTCDFLSVLSVSFQETEWAFDLVAELVLQELDRCSNDGINCLGDVRNVVGAELALHPVGKTESCHVGVERHGVSMEEIWHDNRISGKL
jgi:hypothetical protein